MTRLPPKPKKNDNVERVDMTRMFGRVIGFREGYTFLLVEWDDNKQPQTTLESPENLALVRRI